MMKKFNVYQITCLFDSIVNILVIIDATLIYSLMLGSIRIILYFLCLWCFKTKFDHKDNKLTIPYTVKIDYKCMQTETVSVDNNPLDLA